MPKPIVAIVGRANVGKSTLFNRITGGRTAIVEDVPGVTRDRVYKDTDWGGISFTLVDTGGMEVRGREDILGNQVRNQAQIAMEESDVIIFLVDGKTGATTEDELLAKALLRSSKPVILAVNKIDNMKQSFAVYDFYKLGFGEPIPLSAEHGMNVGDLLDAVIAHIKEIPGEEEYEGDAIKVAIVGRPNVGKSSLVNRLLGQERVIVSDIPGTTRDAIDTLVEHNGNSYLLIDTAGIRRRSKIADPTEKYSVSRSLRAIERCDVALLILDASEEISEQDRRIAGFIHEAGKAVVIIVNKWDLIEKDDRTMDSFDANIRKNFVFMRYAPTLYISALTNQRVPKIFEMVDFVVEQATLRVPTRRLNEVFEESVIKHPPPSFKGKRLKVYYITQVKVQPPTFLLFVNEPKLVHFAYRRFLENRIREEFGFEGTPIRLVTRKKE
ncbi:MAG: ribosome biogenesis GTPase Der [Bacillota bacterium]|jgi:GTP-binding protein